jgi:hypothetical protein
VIPAISTGVNFFLEMDELLDEMDELLDEMDELLDEMDELLDEAYLDLSIAAYLF